MATPFQFETPENVELSYQAAGLGTRFIAVVTDQIILALVGFCIVVFLACSGIGMESVLNQLESNFDENDPEQALQFVQYFVGIIWLLIGLGSFAYYSASELFLRGQTIGKRSVAIRVVKHDGFGLNPGSILLRNLFRIVDNIPLLWIVPLISKKSQRLGDMVAGTIVVTDDPEDISHVRSSLTSRNPAECRFQFDAITLGRLQPQDIKAIEKLLDRWHNIDIAQQRKLLEQIVGTMVKRLQITPPDETYQLEFLQDLLSAEFRRQYRKLG